MMMCWDMLPCLPLLMNLCICCIPVSRLSRLISMLNYVELMCRRQSPESGYWTFWNLPKTILHRLLGGRVSPHQSEFGQSGDVCDILRSGALDLHKSSLVLCFQKYSIQTWWDRYSCCGFIIVFWYASICLCCLYDFMCLCCLPLFEKHISNQMQYP